MCEIIAFEPIAKSKRQGGELLQGDAEILFFTGVRYMRMDEPPQPAGAPRTHGGETAAGKKRKRRVRA